MSLARPELPLHAKTLQAHKTKASTLGLSAAGQQGNITVSSGAFNYFPGRRRGGEMESGSGRKRSYLVRDECESERSEIHQPGHSGRTGQHRVFLSVCVCVCSSPDYTQTQTKKISLLANVIVSPEYKTK